MPRIPILMPQLGESIAEATVVRFPFAPGDHVEGDAEILEVETNKATMGVTTPCPGKIAEWSVELSQSYAVGATLGWLEVSEAHAQQFGVEEAGMLPAPSAEESPADSRSTSSDTSAVTPLVRGLPVPAHGASASYVSPRMKARMNELGFRTADLAGIAGSGAAGRVTVEDLEAYLRRLSEMQQTQASTMRVAVADAMRRSWTRPLATVGRYISLEAVLAHRKAAEPKAGPALYALRALALALADNKAIAGRLIGKKVVHPKSIDVGVAVETEDGVLVPVFREADQTPLASIITRYNELVALARQRRLPANSQGG